MRQTVSTHMIYILALLVALPIYLIFRRRISLAWNRIGVMHLSKKRMSADEALKDIDFKAALWYVDKHLVKKTYRRNARLVKRAEKYYEIYPDHEAPDYPEWLKKVDVQFNFIYPCKKIAEITLSPTHPQFNELATARIQMLWKKKKLPKVLRPYAHRLVNEFNLNETDRNGTQKEKISANLIRTFVKMFRKANPQAKYLINIA